MLGWFKASPGKAAAASLYETTLAAARQMALYSTIGTPDTVEGRFEMLALHLAVLLDRLGKSDEAGNRLSKRLTEQFVEDMDDAMRARGIGDLKVPGKVKKAAAALYDRHRAYGAVISAGNSPEIWVMALDSQLAGLAGREQMDILALARYSARLAPHLAVQIDERIAAGQIDFPHASST